MKTKFVACLALITLTTFFGCGKQKTLFLENGKQFNYSATKENVALNLHVTKSTDKTQISNKNILDKYQPLELKIENNSDATFDLEAKNINLELAVPKDFAPKSKNGLLKIYKIITNSATIMICILLCIASLFAYFIFFHKTILLLIPLSLVFVIPLNFFILEKLKKPKIDPKSPIHFVIYPESKIEISPKTSVQKIIFVDKDKFKNSFEISFKNRENDQFLIFFIEIK
ncbi:TPA: hypothetical protein DEO28_04575 [Candidatus Dependentiae bacterium]|nr:MAG: hypothetical protein UR14_C0002G0033 [candidate division TM6 bacterium GW2011_GWE2_31_21]KKP53830.1 MAG: hypothetical protein UR43_C0002G0033 [candidate division TM6 bacterium GW2011_GWF2_33_332]HBS47610.1 hypothetical protein [Candidatus Dependentiae bacterium]HBZ73759.1 hypothetical protein [Candidatus Dependentiae bacterium]